MTQHADDETERSRPESDGDVGAPEGPDAEPVYNDPDKLDFDPKEGLLSGTAIHGGTAIPGEHQMVDDVPEEDDDDGDDGDDDDDEKDDESA